MWAKCHSAGEVKIQRRYKGTRRDKSKQKRKADSSSNKSSHKGKAKSRDQLAIYVQQVFMENRRFIPAFLLDESYFHLFIFDRSGAAFGKVIDYHAKPLPFCALILALLIFDEPAVGFNPSIGFQNDCQLILTEGNSVPQLDPMPTVPYIVDKTVFHSTRPVGKGEVYWLAHSQSEKDTHFVLLDSWTPGGYDGQKKRFLDATERINGVASVIHIQNVRLDSFSHNRLGGACVPRSCVNKVYQW